MRMPGWYPDAIPISTRDGTEPEYVFPDEAIKYVSPGEALSRSVPAGFYPFPVPHSEDIHGTDTPFLEPKDASDWTRFNRWIYGHAIPEPARGEALLTTLIRHLADHVRRYNAALYRLRRLHFYNTVSSRNSGPSPTIPLPPQNPHGDPSDFPLPAPDSDRFCELAKDAEKEWTTVTTVLNAFIEAEFPPPGSTPPGSNAPKLKIEAADMIEVNGYIVSMRVVASDPEKPVRPNEVGGSSSHVSVSSAFSSSSSPQYGGR
jgi:hypothetical protein